MSYSLNESSFNGDDDDDDDDDNSDSDNNEGIVNEGPVWLSLLVTIQVQWKHNDPYIPLSSSRWIRSLAVSFPFSCCLAMRSICRVVVVVVGSSYGSTGDVLSDNVRRYW